MADSLKLDLGLSEKELRELVGEAILRRIDPEAKETIIAKAIEYLIRPEAHYSGRKVSPIEKAFEEAAEDIARKMVHEQVEQDTAFRAKIHEVVTKGVLKWMEIDGEEAATKIANKISEVLQTGRGW